ncbi:type II toxin-antitoxin system RelE family toxin [Streptococcus massiliensis]|uniref:Plasmid stabilization system n=1 Tax=Streptococcus massiliensis TaxID=313439 RepID=A0A380L155_9STRE|nr:type II toxin-antitoxin system RelE/ParE family toxin [Streptococcus massiliensis]SUN77137.1 plasmid stabilization system [Streptococcus massiliensis]
MTYKVTFTKHALKQLKKLDRYTSRSIYEWIMKHLEGTDDPRRYGKCLTTNRSGEWYYLNGNCRVLANILDDKIVIEVFAVGHRRDIY